MIRAEIFLVEKTEYNSGISETVVQKCYTIKELFDRTMAGMPCSVANFPVEHRVDGSDFLGIDLDDDPLVRMSQLEDLQERLSQMKDNTNKEISKTTNADEKEEVIEDSAEDETVEK